MPTSAEAPIVPYWPESTGAASARPLDADQIVLAINHEELKENGHLKGYPVPSEEGGFVTKRPVYHPERNGIYHEYIAGTQGIYRDGVEERLTKAVEELNITKDKRLGRVLTDKALNFMYDYHSYLVRDQGDAQSIALKEENARTQVDLYIDDLTKRPRSNLLDGARGEPDPRPMFELEQLKPVFQLVADFVHKDIDNRLMSLRLEPKFGTPKVTPYEATQAVYSNEHLKRQKTGLTSGAFKG